MNIVLCHSEGRGWTESNVDIGIIGVRVYIHTTFRRNAAQATYI